MAPIAPKGSSPVSGNKLATEATDLALCVKSFCNDNSITQIQVVPPETVDGASEIHLVFVVDVSGSMGSAVESTGENGEKESHGFTILDLVKHSLLTIVHSLSEVHFVTLVSFSTNAEVVLEGQKMDKRGLKQAETAIKSLHPTNSTNLWGGLKQGMDCVSKVSDLKPEMRHEIMLFTDGMPNVEPPRGHIPTMQRYMEDIPNHCVRTYGFGYSLDSQLLSEIACVGNGTFSFIPDAGFVGTIFIHAVADILCNCNIRSIKLNVAAQDGGDLEFVGNYMVAPEKVGKKYTIPLGGVQIGQVRDVVVRGNSPVSEVSISYFDCVAKKTKEIVCESFQSCGNKTELLKPQFLRLEMCQELQKLVGGRAFGTENTYRYGRSTNAADNELTVKTSAVRALIEKYKSDNFLPVQGLTSNGHVNGAATVDDSFEIVDEVGNVVGIVTHQMKAEKLVKAIMQDLEGQVSEAFEKAEWYNKWGEYYLRSLVFAHQEQKRNNFKDFGVQEYGGRLFEGEVDRVNDIFDSRPAPEPSIQRGSGCAAPRSMAMYNNCAGPCFAPECLVTMSSGVTKACKDIRKGDLVRTGLKGEIARILCVIKTVGDDMVTVQIGNQGLRITPWHPIYCEQFKWVFPAQVAIAAGNVVPRKTKVVYNFVLEPCQTEEIVSNPVPFDAACSKSVDHTIVVNGAVTCTLGHGLKDNAVIDHPYFGNIDAVIRDLQTMNGWEHGFVQLEADNCCVKDEKTGMVSRMQQVLTEENLICHSEMARLLLRRSSPHYTNSCVVNKPSAADFVLIC